jgi:hypothetical protein
VAAYGAGFNLGDAAGEIFIKEHKKNLRMQHKRKTFSVVGNSPMKTAIKKVIVLTVLMVITFIGSYIFFKVAMYFELDFDTPVRKMNVFSWMLFIGLQIFLLIPFLYYLGLIFLRYIFNKFDL